LSFVIDEIRPVSRWKEFGYDSPAAAAQDWDNLQAAHWICNAKKSNKIGNEARETTRKINIIDGNW
jgi:5-methylcytosine-specific restriction endonuclease McrA